MRKAKVVVRHFPHEVSDLDPVLTLLEAEGDNTDNWETRYVLLLWMSMLVLIPFDMKRFDSGEKKDTVTERILAVIQSNLRWSNKSQVRRLRTFPLVFEKLKKEYPNDLRAFLSRTRRRFSPPSSSPAPRSSGATCPPSSSSARRPSGTPPETTSCRWAA